MTEKYTNIWIDGACEPNPGHMGIGIHIVKSDGTIEQFSNDIGLGTNNIAEYTAFLTAVKYLKANKIKRAYIHSDSALVVNQSNGRWKVRDLNLKSILNEIKDLIKPDDFFGIKWVTREQNVIADELAVKSIKKYSNDMAMDLEFARVVGN